jgi:hyaluronoglucosaminidase
VIGPPLGIVEGFFGPLWSWADREYVVRTLAPAGYARYVYAPKADAALRREWDSPYEARWLRDLASFASYCEAAGVEFGVGISPYGLHSESGTQKIAVFRDRLRELGTIGVKRIAVLFDDMETGTDSLADAQITIVDAATQALPDAKFVMCPSYYSDDIVLDRVFGERPQRYLDTLGRGLDPAIEIFWTGPEVCSRQISKSHLQRIGETLRRKPTLWDNYPVNDGPRMSTQLHLRGFTGREVCNAGLIASHMINPALQPTLSTIAALTLADVYAQGERYDYADSFFAAATAVAGEHLASALREDLLAMQDTGLHRLGDKVKALECKYAAFDHPAAREVLAWLRGAYAVSAEAVQTQ